MPCITCLLLLASAVLAVLQPSSPFSPAQRPLKSNKAILERLCLACLVVCNLLPVASWY